MAGDSMMELFLGAIFLAWFGSVVIAVAIALLFKSDVRANLFAELRARVVPAPVPPPPVDPKQDQLLTTPWRKTSKENLSPEALKAYLRKKLIEKNTVPTHVQICGLIGSGKSSFINTSETACQPANEDETCSPTVVRFSDKSVSHENTMVTLTDTNIHLKDFAGFSPSANREEVQVLMDNLEVSIKGWMPDNQTVDSEAITARRKTKQDLTVAVIVVDGSDWVNLGAENKKLLRDVVALCQKYHLNPLIVLTKMDDMSSLVEKNASNMFYSEKVHKLVKEVSKSTGVQENLITPVVNYTSQTQRDDNIDAILLYTLTRIIRRQKDFQKNQEHSCKPTLSPNSQQLD